MAKAAELLKAALSPSLLPALSVSLPRAVSVSLLCAHVWLSLPRNKF